MDKIMKKTSGIITEMREAVKDLHQSGVISDKRFDEYQAKYFHKAPDLTPNQIKQIRAKMNVTQEVFATLVNVHLSTIRKWETGEKHPSGIALRFLEVIDNNGPTIIYSTSKETISKRLKSSKRARATQKII